MLKHRGSYRCTLPSKKILTASSNKIAVEYSIQWRSTVSVILSWTQKIWFNHDGGYVLQTHIMDHEVQWSTITIDGPTSKPGIHLHSLGTEYKMATKKMGCLPTTKNAWTGHNMCLQCTTLRRNPIMVALRAQSEAALT